MERRWQNQEEAFRFAMRNPNVMLDMDMGTGKTRVAIDVCMEREQAHKILVVCPKAVVPVWRTNLEKFAEGWTCWDYNKGSVAGKTENLREWLKEQTGQKVFVVLNYDAVWRSPMGDFIYKAGFDTVILDESHRAKAAGSKVSKYLAVLGKKETTQYKMCLSGTPMANSPLDVYGQYRFLDPSIFGTNYSIFQQQYAIMGGPDYRFVVGYKNQQILRRKFASIAYTCKMEDIKARLKLPSVLPPVCRVVQLPQKDRKTIKDLNRDFIAECSGNHVVVNNVLTKMLRIQQITSGFCIVQSDPLSEGETVDLNTAKEDELFDMVSDVSPLSSLVVFCVFKHDIQAVRRVARKAKRECFELSGDENTLEEWKKCDGAIIAVQIQAGAEGVDMTKAHHAIYYSLPHSLALYNQSKARLYRPGQTHPVSFCHLIAGDTIDAAMYDSLIRKEDIITAIKNGQFNFGYTH